MQKQRTSHDQHHKELKKSQKGLKIRTKFFFDVRLITSILLSNHKPQPLLIHNKMSKKKKYRGNAK